ncbi:MAG TPA: tetratricopeptide repeat protein [Terriglobia bacterium]|nr:tetratricopeptide repeat protein [Terriglobia bacterium]
MKELFPGYSQRESTTSSDRLILPPRPKACEENGSAQGWMKRGARRFVFLGSMISCLVVAGRLGPITLQAQVGTGTTLSGVLADRTPNLPSPSSKSQNLIPGDLNTLFRQAVESQKAGNLEQAAREYQQILMMRPEMPEVLNNLGVILQTLGDSMSARKKYEAALRVEPDFDAALNNLASLLYSEGEYSRARDLWLKAVAKDPLDAELRVNLALGYLKTGEPDKSIRSLRKALTLNPKHSAAHYVLGEILQEQGDYEGALQAYMGYLESKPEPGVEARSYVQHQIAELKGYLGILSD